VTCPVAPETTFALGEGNTNIVVQSVGSIAPAFYIGPADGDLSVAANWSDGVVPTSGNPVIWCANPATLIVGDTFRADTITIPEYSSVVTSSAGNLHLAALTNASNLAIAQGASLTIDGDLVGYAADNTKPLLYSNYGTVTVGGKVHFRDCSNVNKALSTVAQYAVADANSTPIIASGLAYNAVWNESANNWYQDYLVANLGSMNNAPGKWVVGANGLKFPASRTIDQSGFAVKGSQAVTLYSSADWTLDESSRHKGNDLYLRDTATVTIDTTDYNDHTTPRTVTLKGYVNATGSAATPLTITGNGTVVLDAIPANNRTNIVNGAIAVENGATLQINKDVVVGGTGSISLAAGTTLALPANDDKTFSVRDIVPLTLPTEGTATLRIDGARLKSGDYVILDSVPTGYAEHLTVTGTAIDGRRTELKDDGTSLILTIVPRGFIISVF
jgi:hypothetical protein